MLRSSVKARIEYRAYPGSVHGDGYCHYKVMVTVSAVFSELPYTSYAIEEALQYEFSI